MCKNEINKIATSKYLKKVKKKIGKTFNAILLSFRNLMSQRYIQKEFCISTFK